MRPAPGNPEDPASIDGKAAAWVLRADRGLSSQEQDEYSEWLAADPRHGSAIAAQRWNWEELDRLAGLQTSVHAVPDPDLLAPKRSIVLFSHPKRRAIVVALSLAAAAAIVAGFWLRLAPSTHSPSGPAQLTITEPFVKHVLEDGSTVEINRGGEVAVAYDAGERRFWLNHGEATFTAAKDPQRPFLVEAHGIAVRAVGTAFNVSLGESTVDVLVTEGRVNVLQDQPAGNKASARRGEPQSLGAGQSISMPLTPTRRPLTVMPVTAKEANERLAWHERLLNFTDASLSEITREFNQRNQVQLVIADPALRSVHLSASIHSDNVAGFVRLMESDFGMRAEHASQTEIRLYRAK